MEDLNTSIEAMDNAKLSVSLNGQSQIISIPKGNTILQTLKEADTDQPYSCASGFCGTCVTTVTNGRAEMKSCMALEEKEIAKGLILTCQALPTTSHLAIEFKDRV